MGKFNLSLCATSYESICYFRFAILNYSFSVFWTWAATNHNNSSTKIVFVSHFNECNDEQIVNGNESWIGGEYGGGNKCIECRIHNLIDSSICLLSVLCLRNAFTSNISISFAIGYRILAWRIIIIIASVNYYSYLLLRSVITFLME